MIMRYSYVRNLVLLSLAYSSGSCKTANPSGGSGVNVVGGTDIPLTSEPAVRFLATGCTGTFVTFPDFPKHNYSLTTTSCANEIKSRIDSRSKSPREAVMAEVVGQGDNNPLGLIDFVKLIIPSTGEEVRFQPATVTLTPPRVRDLVTIYGFGCQALDKPTTDMDHPDNSLHGAQPQKRMGTNTVETVDLKNGIITLKGPINPKNGRDVSVCPKEKMVGNETADEGSPIFWGGKDGKDGKDKKVGAIVLYSKVVGNEIVTTAKLLSHPTTAAFLKKWLYQDQVKSQPAVATNPTLIYQPYNYTKSVNAISNNGDKDAYVGADWAPSLTKASCNIGDQVTFLSSNDTVATMTCNGGGKKPDIIKTETAWIDFRDNWQFGVHNGGADWSYGNRKTECSRGFFVAGLAMSGASPVGPRALLCAQSTASGTYKTSECNAKPATGKCEYQSEYLAGVAVKWYGPGVSTLVGILCCPK